jgi:hypothetical protein
MDDFENGVSETVCETSGNDGTVRIETDGELTSLVISISHEDFKQGQIYFETDASSIVMDLALVYRDVEGSPIEQLTQNFTLNVTDSAVEQEQDCRYQTLKKRAGARYDQIVTFPAMSDTSVESWAMFHLERPIELDFSEFDAACMAAPFYELYVGDQESGLYGRFSYIWNEFSESNSGVKSKIKSHFKFDEATGALTLEFSYSEYQAFKERFMTQYSGIDFKVVARLPGSQYEGTTVGWGELVSVLFNLKFIEPEEADKCLEHKFSLTGTEVATNIARETDIVIDYQIAQIGTAATTLTVSGLGVQSNNDDCQKQVVLEYWSEIEMMWVTKYDDEYTTANLNPDVMTVNIHIDQDIYLKDLIYSFGGYDDNSTTAVVP